MNAVARNFCEQDLLNIAYEVIEELGFDVQIETEAFTEGGLKECWKFLGDNSAQLLVLAAILTVVFTYLMIPDSEAVRLDKELKRLSIEKLKKELSEASVVGDQTVDEVSTVLAENNGKIIVKKSEYYKRLALDPKVESVGYSVLDDNKVPIGSEKLVQRGDFPRFILLSNKLPKVVLEDAFITIVSPVLKEGRAKWKGFFNDETISFEMYDHNFKDSVLSRKVSFTSGDSYICVLEVYKELNEVGDEKIINYRVTDVLKKVEDGVKIETESGKSYRKAKEMQSKQGVLGLD